MNKGYKKQKGNKMRTKHLFIFGLILIVLGAGFETTSKAGGDDDLDNYAAAVNFPDPNLEEKIRAAIGKAEGEIKITDLVGKRFIVFDAQSSQVKDLTGLEYCTDLIVLRLMNNQIQNPVL